ncbi:Chymotrypsin-like protease CTRL-1, partial [Paramuricea clavata]
NFTIGRATYKPRKEFIGKVDSAFFSRFMISVVQGRALALVHQKQDWQFLLFDCCFNTTCKIKIWFKQWYFSCFGYHTKHRCKRVLRVECIARYCTKNNVEVAQINETGSELYGCGRAKLFLGKVVSGQPARPNSWPWQVSLRSVGSSHHFCGGSLISDQWVVTAAHCLERSSASSLNVRLEAVNYERCWRYVNLNYDIALIKLSRRVTFTPQIQPVCLPQQGVIVNEVSGKECYITGWGRTRPGQSLARALQQARLPVISESKCREHMRSHGRVTRQMICAGFGGSSTVSGCQGDSGGPFVCRDKSSNRWILQGAVSWGTRTCSAGYNQFTVFARVSEFANWIKQHVTDSWNPDSLLNELSVCPESLPQFLVKHDQFFYEYSYRVTDSIDSYLVTGLTINQGSANPNLYRVTCEHFYLYRERRNIVTNHRVVRLLWAMCVAFRDYDFELLANFLVAQWQSKTNDSFCFQAILMFKKIIKCNELHYVSTLQSSCMSSSGSLIQPTIVLRAAPCR